MKNSKSLIIRLSILAKSGELIFHTRDLANLWGIQNNNTIYTLLKRYSKKGLLLRIHKGLYSLKPTKDLNPWLLGLKVLHQYGYVSAETILIGEGIIQQQIDQTTLVSSVSKKFFVSGIHYHSRKLADKFLYNPVGIRENNGIRQATIERAIADLLYFNPKIYFDADSSKIIKWKGVMEIQNAIGYPLTPKRYR